MMYEKVSPQQPTTWLDHVGSFIDRCVYAVSPAYGAARIRTREWHRQVRLSTYEGATQDNTRGHSWLSSRLSPDSALEADLSTLRLRGRELYRNDSYGGAVDSIVNHVVGTGFTPQCQISERIVGTEASEVFREEIEGIYERWSKQCDISGRMSLWQQSRLVQRHVQFDGEALAVMSDDQIKDSPIPLTVEVIDPERLETPPGKIGDPLVRLGVEKDAAGRIVAYWIRRHHPGDTLEVSEEYDRVPAGRVLHIFERLFAGQTRGLPWLCRALNRIKDCKDLDEAEIIACQVQACFAVFVRTPGNPATRAAAAANATDNTNRYEDIRPGAKHYLGVGEEVDFANPQRGNGFSATQECNYRRIAGALNIPYEILMKNWSGVSFAGGRLVLAEFRLDTKSRQKLLVEQFLCPVWHRMVDESVILGQSSIEPRNWLRRPWVYHQHCWTPPAWPYAITPGEEIKANIDAVENNQKTLAEVIGENAGDLEAVLNAREREVKMQRDRGILPPKVLEAEAAAMAPQQLAQQAEVVNGK